MTPAYILDVTLENYHSNEKRDGIIVDATRKKKRKNMCNIKMTKKKKCSHSELN